MNTASLTELLEQVKSGELSISDALARLKSLPFEDLGFARLDNHRPLRKGFAEVVYCEGKTPEQTAVIFERLASSNDRILGTRASAGHFNAVRVSVNDAEWIPEARIIRVMRGQLPQQSLRTVQVLAAGTSDIPVAEEAAVTAETLGSKVERAYDVGVAGIHRLLDITTQLQQADCIVVAAGMEGALPSVVAGLVAAPVIALPTSVGYGASFNGLAALLAMLNSCATGLAVVNIDNGLGAGYFAHIIANGGGN